MPGVGCKVGVGVGDDSFDLYLRCDFRWDLNLCGEFVGVGDAADGVARGTAWGEAVGLGFARIVPPMGRREKLGGVGVGVGEATFSCDAGRRATLCGTIVGWGVVYKVAVGPPTRCGEGLRGTGVGV